MIAGGMFGQTSVCVILTLSSIVLLGLSQDAVSFITVEDEAIVRHRRATTSRVFVVSNLSTGNLFTVAPSPGVDRVQNFIFSNPIPSGLSLDGRTGMISALSSLPQNVSGITFTVLYNNSATVNGVIQVTVYVVSRSSKDPIFTNVPMPLWTTCPVWIRPGTVIYTVQSIDQTLYKADVRYRLETGGDGLFGVDANTGEVYVIGRQMFLDQKIYSLAISAQVVGAANNTATPAQIVNIQVGYRAPQPYLSPYSISVYENATAMSPVATVQAKSFQNLPLRYTMSTVDTLAASTFSLDESTGVLTLRSALQYASSQRLFTFQLTIAELYSNFTTIVPLTITLLPVNHSPFFGVLNFVVSNIPENAASGTPLTEVIAYDIDPGQLGTITYSVTNPLFDIVPTGNQDRSAQITVKGRLDYDYVPGHRYQFSVVATDGGSPPLSASANVTVWMQNVNDEPPIFEPANQVVEVKKTAPVFLPVHYIQAYDIDGSTLSFTLADNNDAVALNYLGLNSSNGQIYLKQQIPSDFATPQFILNIMAMDSGSCCPSGSSSLNRQSVGQVTVLFIGVNTQPTFPECHTYRPTISEGMPPNTTVLPMLARDVDVGSNGVLSFSTVYIDPNVNNHVFGIRPDATDPKKAVLYSRVTFDRESSNYGQMIYNGTVIVTVTVKVQDNGSPSLSTNCFLFVTILDVNDNPPSFDYTNDVYVTLINLAGLMSTNRVYRVFATDSDTGVNAVISYSLGLVVPSCNNCFTVDSSTGWIRAGSSVGSANAQTYYVAVVASNPGDDGLFATANVTIINDRNARLPVWNNISQTFVDDYTGLSVLENFTSFTPITNNNTQVLMAISSGSPFVNYALSSDNAVAALNGLGTFTLLNPNPWNNASLMVIAVASKSLDASVVNQYILRCRASVPQSNPNIPATVASVARLQLNVIDVNNQVPLFQGTDINGGYPAAVSSYTNIGDPVVYVTAIDLDRTAPFNVVTYSFASDCPDCSAFSLDSVSGLISSKMNNFGAEKTQYLLKVVAVDGAPSSYPYKYPNPNQALITVQVTVTSASVVAPLFSSPLFSVTIPEGSPMRTSVLNVTAQLDESDFAQYQIQDGNSLRRFAVDNSTGMIYTVGELLYSSVGTSVFNLTYRAFDGYTAATTIVSVTIASQNLFPPVFNPDTYQNNLIIEKTGMGQISQVQTVSLQPARPGSNSVAFIMPQQYLRTSVMWSPTTVVNSAAIFYSIIANAVSVEGNTGVVKLTMPLGRDLPYGFNTWQFNVAANNEPGSSSSLTGYGVINLRLIDVNDNVPTFDTCCLVGSVAEQSSAGAGVIQLSATDPDAGLNGTVTYSLVSATNLFSVSTNGLVTITSTGSATLDSDVQNNYSIVVRASDGGNPSKSTDQNITIFVLDANDEPPVFPNTQYAVAVPELMPVGASVIALSAVDNDAGSSLTYSVLDGVDSQYFYADSISASNAAVIRIKQVISSTSLAKNYQFTVRVTDGKFTASAPVTVTVYDSNNNAPVFSPSSQVALMSLSTSVNTAIATVTATDADYGVNANFSYYVDYSNTDPLYNFKVNPQTGVVSIRTQLRPDTPHTFILKILAIDRGVPPQTGTATLSVTVTDSNSNGPRIVFLPNYPPVVPTSTTAGQKKFCFSAESPVPISNPAYTFSYVCNSLPCRDFRLTTQTGNQACLEATRANYTRAALGFSTYSLNINISDNGNPVQWAVNQLTLVVEGSNDSPPQPGTKTVVVNTYNGVFSNVPLGNVYVVQPNIWDLSDYTYEMKDSDNGQFSVSPTGQLTMNQGTTKGNHVIKVDVRSTKWQTTVTCTITVTVNYLNDSAVQSSGSIRLQGVGDYTSLLSSGKILALKQSLSRAIGTSADNVDIITVNSSPDSPGSVDVTYAAHGSPYYTPEKLNSVVTLNRNSLQGDTGLTIGSSPVDLCAVEMANCGMACTTEMRADSSPLLVNINSTSFVGVNVTYVKSCAPCDMLSNQPWSDPVCTAYSCLNNGICQQSWSGYNCSCPLGFEGPRCQMTKITFSGSSGYALIKPLQSCADDKLSFEFMTQQSSSNQLLMYAGPFYDADASNNPDFISVELYNGFPRLRINLGDGELQLPPSGGRYPSLADGNWHVIEIFRQSSTRQVRMVVDHCDNAVVNETISWSTEDRSMCDFQGTAPGDKFLLSVSAAVQLGGRNMPNNSYPAGLSATGFQGCIKNFIHNGELFDLFVGSQQRLSQGAQNGCAAEQCSACPGNSSCIGSMNANVPPKCTCYPGLYGAQCNQFASVKELLSASSYANWTFQPGFNTSVNATAQKNAQMSLLFRTRQTDGTVFYASSFTGLERFIVEVIDSQLQVRYDLGSGDRSLVLSGVNVSDGEQHLVRVDRHGNQVVLQLDAGEGPLYAEQWPLDEHRLFRLSSASGGGQVIKNVWTKAVTVQSISKTCIEDVRYAGTLFPLDPTESGSIQPQLVSVTTVSMGSGCSSGACTGSICPSGLVCYDMWRSAQCRCYDFTYVVNSAGQCQPASDCRSGPCVNGDCVVIDGKYNCYCWDAWTGSRCNISTNGPSTERDTSGFNRDAAIAAPVVIIGVLLIVGLIVLLFCLLSRRKPSKQMLLEPDQDTRDNTVNYDEEGAGEEDNRGFDLSRLQKPMNMELNGAQISRWPNLYSMPPDAVTPVKRPAGQDNDIGDYINDRVNDADANQPNLDELLDFDHEGADSQAGSLSSLGSGSSSDANQDFSYLNDWGPQFKKLADLYGNSEDEDETVSNI